MISYAQNFEDVLLHRVFPDRKEGFYIDVGAMDPVLESVTKFFYDEGWSGINIEPNEWFYSKLLQERPRDINLRLALGDREENRELHVFEQYGISTFEESHRDRFVELGYEAKPKTARVSTLAAVCRDFVRREIDFLKVDCEGWEESVLRGADWDRFRPIVVLVEATAPGTTTPTWREWEPFLIEQARYDLAYFDGLNRFYVRREYADLRCHFEVPPNVFDGFKVYATEKAEQTAEALKQERDGLAGRVAELEEKLNGAIAENQRLAEALHAKEAEMEAQAVRAHGQIAELERERSELDQRLRKTRLWVGQLSQDLAASRRR